MAISYATAVKNSRLAAVQTALDAGSGPGKLRIYTAAYAVMLVEIPVDEGNTPTGGVLDLLETSGSSTGNPAASGTAAIARLVDSSNAMVGEGLTVGTTGTDVILGSTAVATGVPVDLTAATITHP
jgi:hypothetical protein